MTKTSLPFPRDAIETCVDRIAASPHFARSPRLIRFLRFTIASMLDGRSDQLKERTVGVEVYDRPLAYDSREDSIVRSEAHRLRGRLVAYYAREGAADPIVVALPKGRYVPELRANTSVPRNALEASEASEASGTWGGCGAIVADFEACPSDERAVQRAGATLTQWTSHPRTPSPRAHDLYVKGRHSAIVYGNTYDPRHLESARRRLRSALESEPDYVDALAELAHLELQCLYPPHGAAADVLGRAHALLERALACDPRHARSLYLLGHAEGSALRPREALRLTESAVANDPVDPEGRTMLAARYLSLGFWESAVAACDWAMALDPVWDAPGRIKTYVLTRLGRFDAARLVIDDMARGGESDFELAIARFDLRLLEGDLVGAEAALSSLESAARPYQDDRRVIAQALVQTLQGRPRDARANLESHRDAGPRFWDHTIRLALALGEHEIAGDLMASNPINGSYRWLATTTLATPYLRRPRWRALAERLHDDWRRDLDELGPSLPVAPPALPAPADLQGRAAPAPLQHASFGVS